MTQHIPITAPSRYTTNFLYLACIGVSGFFVYLFVGSTDGLAADKVSVQWPGLLLMLALLALAFGVIWFALNRRVLFVTDTELVFKTGFYGRTLPISSLRPGSALEISLTDRAHLAPRWRTNGIGLPGLRAGWFRLRNNDRALVYLTDPFHVTYLPTSEGYVLLISTTALLAALREHGVSGSPSTPASAATP